MLIFDTSNINPKSTRDSQGVQVLKSKKNSKMIAVKDVDEMSFKDFDYYRIKNIPGTGFYLKKEDNEEQQLSLF